MKKLLLALFVLLQLNSWSKDSYSLAFYNTENLFDTLPSPKHDDKDFTPEGKYNWNAEKYESKVQNICKTIDQIQADVIALSEIENQEVTRDLVINLKTDYNYIFFDSKDKRGRNLALLYKGDKLMKIKHQTLINVAGRNFLFIRANLGTIPINIIVCHLPSNFNYYSYRQRAFKTLKHYGEKLANENTIIMGDFNSSPLDRIFRNNSPKGFINPFISYAQQSQGSYYYKGKWLMYDNILISESLSKKFKNCGILINEDLINSETSTPKRSFNSGQYSNGFSDHLPVWILLDL